MLDPLFLCVGLSPDEALCIYKLSSHMSPIFQSGYLDVGHKLFGYLLTTRRRTIKKHCGLSICGSQNLDIAFGLGLFISLVEHLHSDFIQMNADQVVT